MEISILTLLWKFTKHHDLPVKQLKPNLPIEYGFDGGTQLLLSSLSSDEEDWTWCLYMYISFNLSLIFRFPSDFFNPIAVPCGWNRNIATSYKSTWNSRSKNVAESTNLTKCWSWHKLLTSFLAGPIRTEQVRPGGAADVVVICSRNRKNAF